MDEIEVDPKLFVTCRLCLEDLGQYQIVPSVQQQIKYCFNIEVEPFDGLPQLICMKCKEILNKFHTIKTTFCEKQINLKNKVVKKDAILNILPQQNTVSSSQQAPETIEPKQPTHDVPHISKKVKSKRKRFLLRSSSSSDSDLESEKSFQTTKLKKKKSSKHRGPMPWEAEYKKMISCKLCGSVWPNRIALSVHSRRSHELLRAKYKNILNRQCTVKLIKIDDKPNLTGLNNMVVHCRNRIVAPGDSYFCTIYTKEEPAATSNSNIDLIQKVDENFGGVSSDGEEDIVYQPTQRKRRLMSRSSNETVVIESNSNKMLSDEEDSKISARNSIDRPLNNDQCISIDSSDSESEQSALEKNGKVKHPIEAQIGDYKIIQGIISMCVNSYHKKIESPEVDDNVKVSNESQLKHKVLSIGRKIINKQGFNCTGLLRYMEHKNLEIVWMAKAQVANPQGANYIRILTKLRGDLNLDKAPGWINIAEVFQSFNSVSLKNSNKMATPFKSFSNASVSIDGTVSMLPTIETSQSDKIDNQAQLETLPAMLYFDSKESTSDLKKLLNANPVANPKQLPKKLNSAQQSVCQTTDDDINFCLPIITSTTSLATIPSTEQIQDSNQKKSVTVEENKIPETTTAPRIKVKPASELMSQKTLNSMKEQTMAVNSNMFVSQIENVWPPHQRPMNLYVPNIAPQMLVLSPPPQSSALQMPALNTDTAFQPINANTALQPINADTTYQTIPGPMTIPAKPEYIILDTTDFPNTKTESPIQYVKNLLQLHDLFLLDPNEALTDNYHCLIKFKVVFKQDCQKDSPVILCLSLSCFKNTFSFQVKDRNQEVIDMSKISANWQWEILQTYRGDVSEKVLQNARKLGQETFDYTNKLFCLLKAINCRKP